MTSLRMTPVSHRGCSVTDPYTAQILYQNAYPAQAGMFPGRRRLLGVPVSGMRARASAGLPTPWSDVRVHSGGYTGLIPSE